MTTQAIQTTKRDLNEQLNSPDFRERLLKLKVLQPERYLQMTFQALRRNPKLALCTPKSFLGCLLDLAAIGLEPDGRNAHLIPYGSEVVLIIDYKGIKQLLHRNHDVIELHCDVVGFNDVFEVEFGSNRHLNHRPCVRDRGDLMCVYSFARLPGGGEEYEIMSVAEIEAIRRRSKTPNAGPWITDWSEMAKKTVFRRQAKGLPLSPETRDALDRETDGDSLDAPIERDLPTPARAVVAAAKATAPSKTVVEDPSFGAPAAPTQHDELCHKVRELVLGSQYSEGELIAVMKPLAMAPQTAERLEDVADHHLESCIDQWDAALARLEEGRKAKAQPPKDMFDENK